MRKHVNSAEAERTAERRARRSPRARARARFALSSFVAVLVCVAPLVAVSTTVSAAEGESFQLAFGAPATGSHGAYSDSVTTPATYSIPAVTVDGQAVSPTFTITGANSAGCSVAPDGTGFSYTRAGTCVISGSVSGNLDNDSDSDTATGTLTLTVKTGSQSISVTPAIGPVGTPLNLVATGYSGTGAITFAVVSGGTAPGCAIKNSNQVASTGAGTCMVTATIAADANYATATSAPAKMTFNKLSQSISVPTQTVVVGSTITLTSTGSSGTGAITYAVVSGGTAPGCAVDTSGHLTSSGSGTCNVTATIAADSTYDTATSAPSAMTFKNRPPRGTLVVTASSETINAGAAFTETSTLSGVISGDTGHLSGVTYSYSGTGGTNYGPSGTAPSDPGTYRVTPSNATVTITPTADTALYSPIIQYNPGTLTIKSLQLTVTASGGSVVAGTAFHPTASLGGLQNGDTATVSAVTYTYAGVGSTTYGPTSAPPLVAGAYSVTPSDATVTVTPSSHQGAYPAPYDYVAGTLVVTPQPIVIVPVNAPKAPPPPRTFTIKPFAEGSFALGKKLKTQIKNLASEVKRGNYHSVTLQAFTDNVFTPAFNALLNQNRAGAVSVQLSQDLKAIGDKGVSITIVTGFSVVLVSQNATAKGRAANRRVVATLKAT